MTQPGYEAVMSCGDVVDEWDPPQTETRRPDIHMSKCKGCAGKWRRVVEIRPVGFARTEEA